MRKCGVPARVEPVAIDTVEFWFMMQIAMICGFVTACRLIGG